MFHLKFPDVFLFPLHIKTWDGPLPVTVANEGLGRDPLLNI